MKKVNIIHSSRNSHIFLCIILVARNLRVVIAAVGAPQSTLSTQPPTITREGVVTSQLAGITISREEGENTIQTVTKAFFSILNLLKHFLVF